MMIESKFALDEVVYVTYKEGKGILLEIDTIKEILFNKEGIFYFTKNCLDQVSESQVYSLDEFDKIKYLLIEGDEDNV